MAAPPQHLSPCTEALFGLFYLDGFRGDDARVNLLYLVHTLLSFFSDNREDGTLISCVFLSLTALWALCALGIW